jgi:hypothetical protein
MVKALFAGLAGLSAVIAVVQLQGGGGAGSGGDGGAGSAGAGAVADASIADRNGSADAASGTAPGTSADAGAPRATTADAPLRFPAARSDGGPLYVGDAPGRLRADSDAGTADAGSADRPAEASGGASADEVRRLRERVATLEQQLLRANAGAQTQKLEELNQQVASLREQLAQEQGRRQQEEMAAQQARAHEQAAASALARAQQQLTAGDSRVLDTLESASGSLPAPAQNAVQSARTAVQNGDLAAARYWISVALAEEQRRQLNH